MPPPLVTREVGDLFTTNANVKEAQFGYDEGCVLGRYFVGIAHLAAYDEVF
jgi:hypothetical protein